MATTRSTKAQAEEAEPKAEAVVEVDEAIEAGDGTIQMTPVPDGANLFIWMTPGSLLVEENTYPEYKVGGDVRAGRVILNGGDEADQFYMGLPVLYVPRKSPQMERGGKSYAIVRTEEVVGVASFDRSLMPNHIAAQRGPDREPYRLDDEVLAYRGSSQTSSPSGSQASTFASASPFEPFSGGSGAG